MEQGSDDAAAGREESSLKAVSTRQQQFAWTGLSDPNFRIILSNAVDTDTEDYLNLILVVSLA